MAELHSYRAHAALQCLGLHLAEVCFSIEQAHKAVCRLAASVECAELDRQERLRWKPEDLA